MNLQKMPYGIDFIGNDPQFVIRTNPYASSGRRAARTFAISSLNQGAIIFESPHFTQIFNVVNYEDDNAWNLQTSTSVDQVYQQLTRKLKYNYKINLHYEVSIVKEESRVLLTFMDLVEGVQPFNLSIIDVNGLDFPVVANTPGLDRTLKPQYKILAKYLVKFGTSSSSTPYLFFDGSNGKCEIGTRILEPFFKSPDVPPYQQPVGSYVCNNAILTATLLFADQTDQQVGFVKQSNEILLINGKLDDYCQKNNIPDWASLNDEKFWMKNGIDIFGQNQDDTIKTDIFTEQFLYISNFTNNTIHSRFVANAIRKDGSTDRTSIITLSFPAKTISRVPVSLQAIGFSNMSDIIAYDVAISQNSSSVIRRRFTIVPRKFNAKTIFILNEMNLYESVVVEDVKCESTTSGNRIVRNFSDSYLIDDNITVYSAKGTQRPGRELSLISKALDKVGNLLLDGEYAMEISILPGSFIVSDDAEDLLRFEFQFTICNKFNRNKSSVSILNSNEVLRRSDDIIINNQR